MQRLGRLRDLREAAPLSQAELAAAAGLTKGTVGALERGTASARPSTVRALARALGVTPAELAGDVTAEHAAGLPHGETPGLVLAVRQKDGMVPMVGGER